MNSCMTSRAHLCGVGALVQDVRLRLLLYYNNDDNNNNTEAEVNDVQCCVGYNPMLVHRVVSQGVQ